MPHPTSPPSGPRASRSSQSASSTRRPNRGGIQKRTGPIRTDKDGDLVMAASASVGRGSNGRSGGGRGTTQMRTNGRSGPRFETTERRAAKSALNLPLMQKAILQEMGAGKLVTRGSRSSQRIASVLDIITIKGLKQSKAASNQDGGVKDLVAFLERKATAPDASTREMVRIRKSRIEGDIVTISVRQEDTTKITRLDNFQFAGAFLKIEHIGDTAALESGADSETPNTVAKLKAVLSRRYDGEHKLLDLSQLGTDPELVNIGMFSTSSRESKFFPALMKICDSIFTSQQQKSDAVISVSLANNSLANITSVTTLSQTFPGIKNLDLSNNHFKNLGALEGWRWKFRHIDHLVLSGNPLELEVPNYNVDILKWYPTLRSLNGVQVRSSEEVKAAPKNKFPMPILGASFRDEATIGENFVKHFFVTYDSDRTALVNSYYDAKSTFSLCVNASAPRGADGVNYKAPGWDAYIKQSRNLVKVNHAPARMSRLYTGPNRIRDSWLSLPSTRHPDLLTDPQKWCIECNSIPGLADPAGQSISGVGGLIIMVHGEFSEMDVSTGQPTATRSFDRTFVLGPGGGLGGVRVACDTLVLRSRGGFDAWKPDIDDRAVGVIPAAPILIEPSQTQPLIIPEGFGVAAAGKSKEQVEKELMAVELSKVTGMTLEFSGMCLVQSGWSLQGAAVAFEQAKASLPPEAFIVRA